MKLILHHALKDLRAARGPLAVWLVVLLTDSTAQALKLDRLVTDADALETLLGAMAIGGACLLVFGWVLAGTIVQADPLDSPSAFWLTRPFSWRALLASKLLVIFWLFLVLPAGAATAVAAANGARGAVLAQFALERAAVDATLLVPMLVAASIAHNLPRMVLWMTAGLALFLALHFGVLSAPGVPGVWGRSGSVRLSGLLLAMGCLVAGGLALLAHQYATRATRRTAWLAGGLVVLAVLAADFWPLGLVTELSRARLDARFFDPSRVRLSVDPDTLRRGKEVTGQVMRVTSSGRRFIERSAPRVDVRGVVRAEGVPPGWFVRVQRGTGDLTLGQQQRRGLGISGVYTADAPSSSVRAEPVAPDGMAAFEYALGARIVNTAEVTEGMHVQLFALPPAAFQDQPAARAALRATVSVDASRVVLSDAIPLVAGRSCRVAGEEVTILDTRTIDAGGLMMLRHVRTKVTLAPLPRVHVVLRNRRTREALFPLIEREPKAGVGLLMTDMDLTHLRVLVPEQRSIVIDEGWLTDAELLLAAVQSAGTFEKPLVLEGFRLPNLDHSR